MEKRVLMLASVASMIDQFNIPNIKLLKELGYEVDVACNFIEGNTCSNEQISILKNSLLKLNVKFYQIDFKRKVFKLADNIKAFKQVYELTKHNKYKFIHCHTPIGGVIGRIVGKITRTKVIYTAHGFHFFKGSPLINWLIYYPIEKYLAKFTDVLITINKEDYKLAKSKMKAKIVEYVPGVGVDVDKFSKTKVDREQKRKELGISRDDIMLLSVGELNLNKNHQVIIRALSKLNNNKIHYFIVGQGNLKNYLEELSKNLGISENVHIIGFRKDVAELCKVADIFCFPSFREGLGIAGIEAMACGLPLITSNIHGINDYSENEINGYSCNSKDVNQFSQNIKQLIENSDTNMFAKTSYEKAKQFDVSISFQIMEKIYGEVFCENKADNFD